MKKFLKILMFFLIIGSCGCGLKILSGPLIGGIIAWKEGEARKYYDYNSIIVYRSIKHSANELNLNIKSNLKPDENGNSYLTIGENDRFKITIEQIEPHITLVSIRVNTMGDKPYAELIYEKANNHINTVEYDSKGIPI